MTNSHRDGSKYSPPQLIRYGDMAKLTASGLASGKEGSGSGNKGKRP
jgi:hypothetical protein